MTFIFLSFFYQNGRFSGHLKKNNTNYVYVTFTRSIIYSLTCESLVRITVIKHELTMECDPQVNVLYKYTCIV